MRNIIILVFFMFIGGYYLNLENCGNVHYLNAGFYDISKPGSEKNLFTAMLVKCPGLNDEGHENKLASTFSDTAQAQYCAEAGRSSEGTLTSSEPERVDTGMGLLYLRYQQYAVSLNEVSSTGVPIFSNSDHDVLLWTDIPLPHTIALKLIIETRNRISHT